LQAFGIGGTDWAPDVRFTQVYSTVTYNAGPVRRWVYRIIGLDGTGTDDDPYRPTGPTDLRCWLGLLLRHRHRRPSHRLGAGHDI